MNEYIQQPGCPNKFCCNYGKYEKELIAIHDKKLNRLRCRLCGKTWSAHFGEFHYGLRTEQLKIRRAVDLLKVKIPVRMVAKFVKVSPSTAMRWKKKLISQPEIMPVRREP